MTSRSLLPRRAVLVLALLAALVATPEVARRARPPAAARSLEVWSVGPLRIARADLPPYPREPLMGARGAAGDAAPADALTPRAALTALDDPQRGRVAVRAVPDASAPRDLADLFAAVRRRAAGTGELWLVALVELRPGPDGEGTVRLGLEGAGAGPPAGRAGALEGSGAVDAVALEALLTAHADGTAPDAPARWPAWFAPASGSR